MKLEQIIESLHPLERQILKYLKENLTADEIIKLSGLKDVEVMRALQWLESKDAIKLEQSSKDTIKLDKNGQNYSNNGFPEKRFLKSLTNSSLNLNKIKEKANLDSNEIGFSLGFLKSKKLIQMGEKISITTEGKSFLESNSNESFLTSLPRDFSNLSKEEKFILNILKERKEIIKIDSKKIFTIKLKDMGKKLIKTKLDINLIDSLTPTIIKSGSWKNKKFRRYNLNASVGNSYGAKRHIVNQALLYAKRIWLDMGFKEMTGPIVESSFWNFDALFTPQDHPGREMQDTFFLKENSNLPEKSILQKVKKSHESNWNYKWDEKIAKETVIRTHTTGLSARTLAKLKTSDLPAKFFSVGKCFRNEALDWSHHFEFNQTEGIVIDPDANFKHLLGYSTLR